MVDDKQRSAPDGSPLNSGYAAFQLGKALTAATHHQDQHIREKAEQKVRQWTKVLEKMMTGSADYGSTTPIKGIPKWATLEVITGGFATGNVLSGGPLKPHEETLIQQFSNQLVSNDRKGLNSFFLTDAGLNVLENITNQSQFDIEVPEEAALLVLGWLARNHRPEKARELLDQISPYFAHMRFFPRIAPTAQKSGTTVHLKTVSETIEALEKVEPNSRVAAQKEAVLVWQPFHDKLVKLILSSEIDGVPFQKVGADFPTRASALLAEYKQLARQHQRCRKHSRKKGHAYQLRTFLEKWVADSSSLTQSNIAQIKFILNGFVTKRGIPHSDAWVKKRDQQRQDVASPLHADLSKIVVSRLKSPGLGSSIESLAPFVTEIDDKESSKFGVPAEATIPDSIKRKVERCLDDHIESLIERGVITSAEVLADVLPQMTSQIRSLGIKDTPLRTVYARAYKAFRKRRSLLLLNLQKQTQFEDLPWISVLESMKQGSLSDRETSKTVLTDLVCLTLTSFPQVILPNKLIGELRALAQTAKLDIAFTEELAADIFMGRFSAKYLNAAEIAASLLEGTLYANYYRLEPALFATKKSWFGKPKPKLSFGEICSQRAGVKRGYWDPASNGMLIEQQQVLTTHNLASLYVVLGLAQHLKDQHLPMANHCFSWICKRLQTNASDWHSKMIGIKNAAYAWRQMVFFLSFVESDQLEAFFATAKTKLAQQSAAFQTKFQPIFAGLLQVKEQGTSETAPIFLGWSKTRHSLL